ncbi:NitT/TauT family transport system ATP-binding protein [Rhodococcus sp. 27YEA15]|uniref:ABC transporter ATP-binding protein n=1 Tax=Rhodococcus sp. 27YEA15 TaxID=3156259 RepID=UPI003C79DDE4
MTYVADEVVLPDPTGATSLTGNAVEVEDLWVWFTVDQETKFALHEVNLSIPQGQFVSIVGPSGCGKTTLLNAIAGSVQVGHGRADFLLDGRVEPTPSSEVGYMFARDALMPWRSARRNVELGLEIRGVPRSERRTRADEMLGLVGLGGHGAKRPGELSQGMRQRVNLARILAVRPRMLLLDEPFGALDAQTKANMQGEFLRIWEGERTTVVFVTHDLSEAALLSDRIVVMRSGEIVEDIDVPFERPRDLDVLRFDPEFSALVQRLWGLIAEESVS